MKPVIDNFSTCGKEYSLYRPETPQAVYDFLYSHVGHFDTAWDCGTGNGQVALRLAERFKTVYGTDISADQLSHAGQRDNVIYRKERAEHTSFADHTVNLTTVAQAIHWFDFESFNKEVQRVTVPGGFIAAWTYTLLNISIPELNDVVQHYYFTLLKGYWDERRNYVDEEYKTVPFPFDEVQAPEIWSSRHYSLEEFRGYLRTWSASLKFQRAEGKDPTELIIKDLERAWGSKERNEINWPIHVRAGYVNPHP